MNWEQKIKQANREQEDLVKKSLYSDIEKARSGVYTDTPHNRRKGLVGMEYGSEKKEENPIIKKEKSKAEPEKNLESKINWSNSLEYVQQRIFSSKYSITDLLDEKRLDRVFSKTSEFLSNKNPFTNPNGEKIDKTMLREKFFNDKIESIRKNTKTNNVSGFQHFFSIDGKILQNEYDKRNLFEKQTII